MRLEIINRIGDLEDKHCNGCKEIEEISSSSSERHRYCTTHCKIGIELAELGEKLLDISNDRVKQTLKKGGDMTTSDVMKLREKGVMRKDLAKAAGVSVRIMRELEGDEKVSENKSNASKAIELTKQGLSVDEIAEKLGLKKSTVYTYVSAERQRKKRSQELVNKPKKKEVEKVTKNIEKVAVESAKEVVELKKRIEGLVGNLNKESNKVMQLESKLHDVNKENDELRRLNDNAKADHIEALNEIARLKDELESLRNSAMTSKYDEQNAVDGLKVQVKLERQKTEHLLSFLMLDKQQLQ